MRCFHRLHFLPDLIFFAQSFMIFVIMMHFLYFFCLQEFCGLAQNLVTFSYQFSFVVRFFCCYQQRFMMLSQKLSRFGWSFWYLPQIFVISVIFCSSDKNAVVLVDICFHLILKFLNLGQGFTTLFGLLSYNREFVFSLGFQQFRFELSDFPLQFYLCVRIVWCLLIILTYLSDFYFSAKVFSIFGYFFLHLVDWFS